jgi:UDP-GlcNAc:undecaprenyl-phosphate/decaprenyl-phosphate GlcNAc-1-phosphate transferase
MIQTLVLLSFLNFIIFINFNKIANRLNFYDKPDHKLKKHKSKVALLGGIIVFINLFLFLLINIFIETDLKFIKVSNREYLSIFFLIVSFFLLGLYDDKYNLKPERKFILSILFSLIAILINENLIIKNISLSFYHQKIFFNNFSIFFTIFCIIILVNALNFYDGVNGQSLIFFLLVFTYLGYKSSVIIFYLFIMFVIIFLLFLNLKNKVFLGDNGIFILGILLVIMLIYEHNIFETIIFADEIFILLILPGVDLLRLTLTRVLKGKNAFYGDRNHIHHIFLKNFSLFRTNLFLVILGFFPIFFFNYLQLNFFVVFFIFLTIYFLTIFNFNKND